MLRIIITSTALAVCTNLLFSQAKLDNKLLQLEKEIYFSTFDSVKDELLLKKLDYYFSNKNYSTDALTEAKRINYSSLTKKSQKLFLWNASLLSYMNNEKDKSQSYFSVYQRLNPDSSISAKILSVLISSNYDSAQATKIIRHLTAEDTSLICLSCLNKVNEYKRPHKKLYVIASAIIPGSGSMMNGHVVKGFNSLALCSAAGYATYLLVQNNLYANAVLLGGQLFAKFYGGKIHLTGVLFDRKEDRKKNSLAKDCERTLKKVLEKYPLVYR